MNLHEYQAKEILARYDLEIPPFGVVSSPDQVRPLIDKLHLKEAVLKIQVHAGGRGKAGGVKFAKRPDEIVDKARALIGMRMINEQTGQAGIVAHQVMIAQPIDIAKEYYIGALIDRQTGRPLLMASPEGGMEIEEIAHSHPEKIVKLPFEFDGTLRSYHCIRLCKFMGWSGEVAKQGTHLAKALCRAFIEEDASLLEINPLVLTPQDKLVVLDAKLAIDDNALYRHPDIAKMYDPTQSSPQEAAAKAFDLAYIAMEGTIGCMVNGAGLAMATMDIIQLAGGTPANFLDVGGGASKEKVAEGFRIILSDPHVKAILVNIFGGIMNCKTLAEGVIHAAISTHITVPIVVRMEGTNVEEGMRLFRDSKLNIQTASDLGQAASLVVKLSKESHGHFDR